MWKNRIVKHGEENPEQLLANPSNPRIHPELQQNAVEGSLDEIGWIQDVIVNLRTSDEWGQDQNVETMLDGHLRVKLALRRGEQSVPVKYVDLSPREEALALATFDPVTGYAGIDREIMSGLLGEVGEIENDGLNAFVEKFVADIGMEIDFSIPEKEIQEEPSLFADRLVEIYCSDDDLIIFNDTLDRWGERDSVTINIS